MFRITAVRRIREESLRARPSSGVLKTSAISPRFIRSTMLGRSFSATLWTSSTVMPCLKELGRPRGGDEGEAHVGEALGHLEHRALVAVLHGEEDLARGGQGRA